jgi:hypothetical protein
VIVPRICRVVITIAALLFAAVAINVWAAPEVAARRVGLDVVTTAGRATLRADLGGLFASMAATLAFAAWTGQRTAALIAAVAPSTVAAGRLIEWWASGLEIDVAALVIELIVAAAAVGVSLTRSPRRPRHLPARQLCSTPLE